MRLPVRVVGAAMSIVAMLACDSGQPVAPAASEPPSLAVLGNTPLPLQGVFRGHSEVVGLCPTPGEMLVHVEGTGVLTHLGASRLVMEGCMLLTATGAMSSGLTGLIIAANGDTLRFVDLGTSVDFTTGIQSGDRRLDGGSGRFSQARGEFHCDGQMNPDNTWVDRVVSGWISY